MALECTSTPYKMVAVDPRKGDTKTAEFKKVNGLKRKIHFCDIVKQRNSYKTTFVRVIKVPFKMDLSSGTFQYGTKVSVSRKMETFYNLDICTQTISSLRHFHLHPDQSIGKDPDLEEGQVCHVGERGHRHLCRQRLRQEGGTVP